MRNWTVGGALVEADNGLLLVRNQRHGGRHDWTPPGGVIDAGEDLLEGLAREVTEETGLAVRAWRGPAYRIAVAAVDLGWHLAVEAWQAVVWDGELRVGDDPDGIVVEAGFFAQEQCLAQLGSVQPWVADPVREWLDGRWDGTRDYRYEVSGTDLGSLEVVRL
jgi:ADP-ribose pyrophosphatase YjhB (NUDIX family)